ncbi:hypothetical protein NKI13_24465 [Mesorhizobium australicum]|uniref:hypothetical protein n=1 Tax=Mesorhizobium australicum TaxID=536018 RepID=UPI003335D2E0
MSDTPEDIFDIAYDLVDAFDGNGDRLIRDIATALVAERTRAADTLASKDAALAEIRAELERERELKDHARKCCDAAESELAQARKALEAGKPLANAAFNISRMSIAQIDAYHLLSLKAAQEAWDEALSASRALSQDGEER